MSYGIFASYYDELMSGFDYDGLCNYLLETIKKHRKSPADILDLACGSGILACLFAKKGLDVTAVDMSPEMLIRARENQAKSRTPDNEILFLCQDMRCLDLYGTVEAAVCTMDSLNHITDYADLKKVLERLFLFIEPGGIFVFDMNTPYKHEKVLADNAFIFETDNVFCSWQNEYEPQTLTTHITLDFFACLGDNYNRMTEEFSEKAYTDSEISRLLDETGFELLARYDEMTFNHPKPDSQRVFYVVKRREDK